MAEPLLSSLCLICHANPPKYRCPRCSSKTCSLACSKRHKLWSDCNGVRDPTVYKPLCELTTPAGVDHDYNFITSIERGIERTNKLIVEEKGLVCSHELLGAANNHRRCARHHTGGDTTLLSKALESSGVIVEKAPKGMRRNRDNSTKWSRPQKCINWQVEWVRDDGSRILGKALENCPIGETYTAFLEEQRRLNMTGSEKKEIKKRKAEEIRAKEKLAKRAKIISSFNLFMRRSTLQNPESSAWDQTIVTESDEAERKSSVASDTESTRKPSGPYEAYQGYFFYLHRPYTPSSHPRVLIPLSPIEPLSTLLRDRVVLEFPTIYAISYPPASLPGNFMLENDYLQNGRFDPSQQGAMEDMDIEEGEII